MNHIATRPLWDRLALPTWAVVFAVYGMWGMTMAYGAELPWWIFCSLGTVTVAWYGSLQHELLHGHPTRSAFINALLGWAPFSLWMPYHVYRDSHLIHHRVQTLTDPEEDPESYYFSQTDWVYLRPVWRGALCINNALLGRVTIGPAIALIRLAFSESRRMVRGDLSRLPGWLLHGALSVAMLYGLERYLGIPAWYYAVGVAYPSISLILVRSYLEHRPSDNPDHRTAVVEGSLFWSLLFLNVNFHVLHHENPNVPWYKVSGMYWAGKDTIAERNGGYIFKSYGEVATRYFFRPKDMPICPSN